MILNISIKLLVRYIIISSTVTMVYLTYRTWCLRMCIKLQYLSYRSSGKNVLWIKNIYLRRNIVSKQKSKRYIFWYSHISTSYNTLLKVDSAWKRHPNDMDEWKKGQFLVEMSAQSWKNIDIFFTGDMSKILWFRYYSKYLV